MTKTTLGELEEQILLTLLRLGGESYAVPVAQKLSSLSGRDVSPATAYMVMRRLEEHGLVSSSVGTSHPDRGGRPRRYYRVVEDAALPVLSRSRETMLALWDGLEPRLDAP